MGCPRHSQQNPTRQVDGREVAYTQKLAASQMSETRLRVGDQSSGCVGTPSRLNLSPHARVFGRCDTETHVRQSLSPLITSSRFLQRRCAVISRRTGREPGTASKVDYVPGLPSHADRLTPRPNISSFPFLCCRGFPALQEYGEPLSLYGTDGRPSYAHMLTRMPNDADLQCASEGRLTSTTQTNKSDLASERSKSLSS
jgi:hypothetical protein